MIFIRLASPEINEEARFEAIFKDVPADKWKTFSDAEELPKKLFEDEPTADADQKDTDDDDKADSQTKNHAMIQSISFLYYLLSILSIFIFTID